MEYVQVTATVAPADADATSDILRSLADAGTWVEMPFTQPDLESDAVPVAGDVRVHVYFRGADAAANASLVRTAVDAAGIPASVTVDNVAEEDWAEAWKEHFDIERYGERIVVVPSWREYAPREGDVVLMLDPGMAFGTGQHETTRMCLEALERSVWAGARVLDVGCGSGILSIAAAKLAAADVTAVDIDENCVRVTRENARANGVATTVRVGQGSLGEAWPFDAPAASYDVIVANIIARVIVEMAPGLVAALAPNGHLIVSGIIEEREGEVRTALAAARARVEHVRAMGDWRCIEAVHA